MSTTALSPLPIPSPVPVPVPSPIGSLVDLALSGIHNRHTIRAYRSHLTRFLASGLPLTRSGISVWVSRLRTTHGSGSVNQALAAIRKLVDEALENGALDRIEWAGIQAVKGAKRKGGKVGTWLPLPVVEKLLSLPQSLNSNRSRGIRDSALLSVLIGCGLRREEVAGLDISHYSELGGRMVLTVKGKGDKVRTVPVPDWVEVRLGVWLLEMDALLTPPPIPSHQDKGNDGIVNVATYSKALYTDTSNPIFRRFRRGILGNRLGVQGIYYLVRGYGEGIGVPELAPHDLRRTFSRLAREGGAAMDQIQKVMGHSSITVTERYLGDGLELGKGKAANDYIRIS